MPEVYVEEDELIEESSNRVITYHTIWSSGKPGSMKAVMCTEHDCDMMYDPVNGEYYCPYCHA